MNESTKMSIDCLQRQRAKLEGRIKILNSLPELPEGWRWTFGDNMVLRAFTNKEDGCRRNMNGKIFSTGVPQDVMNIFLRACKIVSEIEEDFLKGSTDW